MTQKEFFKKVNELAQKDMLIAQGWLDAYNRDYHSAYLFLNKRVVFKSAAHGVVGFHDAYTWATEESIF